MSNTYLLVNIVIWLITLICYQNKKKQINAGSILLFSYFIYSIASLILFNSSYHHKYNNLNFTPFIYLYLMLMIVMHPILKINNKSVSFIQKPSDFLFNTIALIYMLSSLIYFSTSFSNIYNGIYTIINDPMGGTEIYRDTMDNSFDIGDGVIKNIFAVFSNTFSDIGILLFFYYLTLKKKNKYLLLGLLLSIIASVFIQIAKSQRGPAIDRLFTIIIAYFALKEYIPIVIRNKIKRFGYILLILVTIPIAAITISRFGEREGGAIESVYYYVGQQNLNFNNYGFDNGGLRYGDRTVPIFKSALGFDNVPYSFWERRIKYPNLKINDEVFIGFIGDFVLDFGPYITTIIIILFTINANYRTKIKNNTLLFHQLILLYFIMNLCMQGGMKLFPFSDLGGNLKIIVYILVYFAFKLDYKNSLKYITKN